MTPGPIKLVTLSLSLSLSLSLALCAGCSREATTPTKAASSGPDVPRVLEACEAAARAGDATRFRACLTRASVERLDQTFTGGRARIGRALAQTDALARQVATLPAERRQDAALAGPLSVFAARRAQAQAIRGLVGWESHLKLIARAPKAKIEQVKVTGDAATFVKVLGKVRSTHYLRREGGAWKVDLAANPELTSRTAALQRQAEQAAGALAAAKGPLEAALAGKPGADTPAEKKPAAKTSAAKKPAAKKPAAKKPAAKK